MLGNNRGSILIFSFWAMIILMLMSFGMTRRVNAELSLARHQLGKARSRYAAFAGLFYAMEQARVKHASGSENADTAFACGILLEGGMTSREIFAGYDLGEAVFDVTDGADVPRFGLGDETGKININALTELNADILRALLTRMEVPLDQAQVISASVIDWKDRDDRVFRDPLGAEQDYYQRLDRPYACKNYFFETWDELFLVRGMTREILQKIRPYVTIYPEGGALQVNLNTAPEPVLEALAQASTGGKTGTSRYDAEDFVRTVMDYRSGSDGLWGTADDREVVLGRMSLTGARMAIASALIPVQSGKAAFLRARVVGTDKSSSMKTVLDAVIKADGLTVVALSLQ